MQKIFRILILLTTSVSSICGAATTTPIQLLNPAGSSSGQAIISNGPSTAPAWGSPTVSATSITGILPIANGGTNASTASAALSNLGAAALAGATFTGAITPSQTAGIVGTTTNNNANAGSVGEYICAQVTNGGSPTGCATNSSTPVSLTSNVPANITSISLTAGDWQVCGNVSTNPTGSTTQQALTASINTVSATQATPPNGGAYVLYNSAVAAGSVLTMPTGCMRQLLSSTTTIYLVINSLFSVSTNSGYGFIWARRMR